MDTVTEYEILKDLVTIVLAPVIGVAVAIAVASASLTYLIVLKTIEKKITSAAEIQLDKALLGYFISSGYDYWREYEDHMDKLFSRDSMDRVLEEGLNRGTFPEGLKNMFETKDIPLSGNISITKEKEEKWVITDKKEENIFIVEKENGKLTIYKKNIWKLDQAIRVTERGYEEYATKLEKREKRDNESVWFICRLKNDLAYYYAEKQKLVTVTPSQRASALRFVEYIYNRIDKCPKDSKERDRWVDTRNFVQQQFSLNK